MDRHLSFKTLLFVVTLAISFTSSLYAIPLIANSNLPDAVVDQTYLVELQAMNGRAPFDWSGTSGLPSGLEVKKLLANTWTITGKPDLATEGDYNVTLRVTDSNSESASKILVLTVLEEPPVLEIITDALDEGKEGKAYNLTLEADGGVGGYDWSSTTGLPAWMNLNGNRLAGTAPAGSAATYPITLVVTDGDTPPGRAEVTLDLVVQEADPFEFETLELDEAHEGKLYLETVRVMGGIPPYAWDDPSEIPAWLTGINGSLVGSPPVGSSDTSPYTLTWSVSDSSAPPQTIERSFEIVVPGALEITTTTLPDAWEGEPYTATLSAQGGGQPYDWRTTTGLPEGLSISYEGVISGTPVSGSAGTIDITAKVKDDFDDVAAQPLTLLIIPRLTIDTDVLTAAKEEQVYGATLLASGGHAPYTWKVNGLPQGLELDAETGVLSGSPISGSSFMSPYSVTIEVFDSFVDTNTASTLLELEVTSDIPAPEILTSSLPDVEIGEGYRVELQADFGYPPYRWSARGLPGGMYVSMEGRNAFLIGAGSSLFAGQSYYITLELNDSAGIPQSRSKGLTLTFGEVDVAPPVILNSWLPPVTAGESFTPVALSASGGRPEYTWSMQSDLPGLTLTSVNSRWSIEGAVPETAFGTYDVRLELFDSSPEIQSDTVTLTVFVLAPPPPVIDTSEQREQEAFLAQAALEGAAAGVCSLRHNSDGHMLAPLLLAILGLALIYRKRRSLVG